MMSEGVVEENYTATMTLEVFKAFKAHDAHFVKYTSFFASTIKWLISDL
jgi:hypothetical protein